jgi:hypothetical protein
MCVAGSSTRLRRGTRRAAADAQPQRRRGGWVELLVFAGPQQIPFLGLIIGYWLLAIIGYWLLLVIGYWLLAIGYWLLAIGYWLLAVIGYWLLLPGG